MRNAEEEALNTSIHPGALSPEDLERLTGYQRQGDVEKWLRQHRIPYFRGRIGVWTTLDAVNAALGITTPRQAETTDRQFATMEPNWSVLQ